MAAPTQIMVPMFGYKNHAGIDRTFGFIRKWMLSHAARHDSGLFKDVLDTRNIARSVWADTAYRSAKNEAAICRAKLKSMIHFRKSKGKPVDRRHQRANAARSKVRSAVEHVFATQKSRMGLCVRTIGIERVRMKIGMVNLAYNFKRLVWHEGRSAHASHQNRRGSRVKTKNQQVIRNTTTHVPPSSPHQSAHAKISRFFEV